MKIRLTKDLDKYLKENYGCKKNAEFEVSRQSGDILYIDALGEEIRIYNDEYKIIEG